jgi:hypothetical protein
MTLETVDISGATNAIFAGVIRITLSRLIQLLHAHPTKTTGTMQRDEQR